MKFNKIVIATLVASSVFLVGCGDDKTPEQIQFEQQVKLKSMDQAHQREMARIESSKIEAENPASHTYVDNSTSQDGGYDDQDQTGGNYEPHQEDSSVPQASQETNGSTAQQGTSVPQQNEATQDSGFGAGSMLLAAAGGALAGYAANEMLSNGMKSYQDDNGNTKYTDKDGRPVTQAQYEEKKKTSKVTKLKEKAKAGVDKTKQLSKTGYDKTKTVAKAGVDKTKQTYNNVKASPRTQQIKRNVQYNARKAQVLTKKQYRQAKRVATRSTRRR